MCNREKNISLLIYLLFLERSSEFLLKLPNSILSAKRYLINPLEKEKKLITT